MGTTNTKHKTQNTNTNTKQTQLFALGSLFSCGNEWDNLPRQDRDKHTSRSTTAGLCTLQGWAGSADSSLVLVLVAAATVERMTNGGCSSAHHFNLVNNSRNKRGFLEVSLQLLLEVGSSSRGINRKSRRRAWWCLYCGESQTCKRRTTAAAAVAERRGARAAGARAVDLQRRGIRQKRSERAKQLAAAVNQPRQRRTSQRLTGRQLKRMQ
jgi:hypothetical protein